MYTLLIKNVKGDLIYKEYHHSPGEACGRLLILSRIHKGISYNIKRMEV